MCPDVTDEVLRPALEVAWATATVGSQLRPPIVPPSTLRPLLHFQKLPGKALGTVRRAVEDDEEFRTRVAAVAAEETVGRAAWLWLHRPDGWQEELSALAEAATPARRGEATRQARVDRATAGRLDAAESRVRRLSAELEILRREVGRAQDVRQLAENETTRAKARADELERAATKVRGRLERVALERDEAREAAVIGRAEAEALRVELREAELKLAELDQPPQPVEPTQDAAADAPILPAQALDALGSAAAAASALARSLADLASAFRSSSRSSPPSEPLVAGQQVAGPVASGSVPAAGGRLAPRRRALRIPRGMHAGSPGADAWLLEEANARVIVDGYNVAKLGWPDQPLAEQRERLLDLLDDVAIRRGTSIDVVFDGADVGPVRAIRRRHVTTRFSPAGVLADDVIRDLVATHPADGALVVVTNDRAVGHDVRALGANVMSSGGLLAVARR